MNRTRSILAGALGALFVVAAAGAASAQTATPPRSNTGATAPQPNKGTAAQEQFDREKVTMKDHVQAEIDRADSNIDALKKVADNEKGTAKKQADDAQKKVSMLRDHLKGDLDKIDKASINDWKGVRPVVERDLAAMNTELTSVAAITKKPTTGAAQPQAPNPPQQQQPKQNK
jgi:hypothetical protein